jgi:hypothetical protein
MSKMNNKIRERGDKVYVRDYGKKYNIIYLFASKNT